MAEAETTPSVVWQGHEGPRLARVKDFDIIDCRTCGFVHATPLPDAESLVSTYRDDYYVEEKPTSLTFAIEDQAWA